MYFIAGLAIGLLCGPFILAAIDLHCGYDDFSSPAAAEAAEPEQPS
jgi:hypothetical protein